LLQISPAAVQLVHALPPLPHWSSVPPPAHIVPVQHPPQQVPE